MKQSPCLFDVSYSRSVRFRKPRISDGSHSGPSTFNVVVVFFFFSDPLPPPLWLQDMLMQLRKKGPSTEGVFRKTCNNKNMRDVREQLNSGLEVDLEAQPVLLLVGLLKVGLASACVVQCAKLPPTTKRQVAGAQTQKSFDAVLEVTSD